MPTIMRFLNFSLILSLACACEINTGKSVAANQTDEDSYAEAVKIRSNDTIKLSSKATLRLSDSAKVEQIIYKMIDSLGLKNSLRSNYKRSFLDTTHESIQLISLYWGHIFNKKKSHIYAKIEYDGIVYYHIYLFENNETHT